jgi:predicted permease
MSVWSRIANVFRGERVSREIDEELSSHIDEAVAAGRDPSEARRALGSSLQLLDETRDRRVVAWLDSLRADTVFGWRQIRRKKIASAAAVLSLGLAIGSCTSAFRLIDALLLRPLPVAHPEQLYGAGRQGVDFDGAVRSTESWAYPAFALMRAAVKQDAELIAVSDVLPTDVTFGGDEETERPNVQYVSGQMFGNFGLKPAAGRLLNAGDDAKPGSSAYAVVSYDYWVRRLGRDAEVVGRTFRMGSRVYEVVGVAPKGFTGTETGAFVDVFVPVTMNASALRDDTTFVRVLARVYPGVNPESVRARMDSTSRAFEQERAKSFQGMTPAAIAMMLAVKTILTPAAAGASDLQKEYRTALIAVGVLVALVLLIACANVANLMAAQAASRTREMALRVSIGAGRGRLVQLVLVESGWLAAIAGGLGAWFAWWSAPLVAGMINPPDTPIRLVLPADWRVVAFGLGLTVAVMLLFGLVPALRASAVRPAGALRGNDERGARQGPLNALIATQVAFCFLVLFVAGLFARTFQQLSSRPLGFEPDRVLLLETVTRHAEAPVYWDQAAERLRAAPGVESVALSGWPTLGAGGWNGFVSVDGAPPLPSWGYFFSVSPRWRETMKMRLVAGRDLRENETTPGTALVNETFVKTFFQGRNPLGRTFAKGNLTFTVAGVVGDAPYKSVKEPILPVAYVPLHALDSKGGLAPLKGATFVVKTRSTNPLSMAATLRRAVAQARVGFRVSNVHSQAELVAAQTVRERLIATLALFFAGVALALAAIGLYGVLDYSVLQRRKEIGIRIAIGAKAGDIAWRVTARVFGMVAAGTVVGIGMGMVSVRYIEALLYEVKPGDPAMLAVPIGVILGATVLAAAPAVLRALRIDPVQMLRSE